MRKKQVRNISRMAILSSSKLILCLIFFSTTTTTHIQTRTIICLQRSCSHNSGCAWMSNGCCIIIPCAWSQVPKIYGKKKLFSIFFLPLRFHFFFFFYDFGSHTLSVKERVSTIIPETFLLLKDCKSQTSFIVLFSSSDAHHYHRVHKHSQPDAVPLLITLPGQPLLKCFQTTVL